MGIAEPHEPVLLQLAGEERHPLGRRLHALAEVLAGGGGDSGEVQLAVHLEPDEGAELVETDVEVRAAADPPEELLPQAALEPGDHEGHQARGRVDLVLDPALGDEVQEVLAPPPPGEPGHRYITTGGGGASSGRPAFLSGT